MPIRRVKKEKYKSFFRISSLWEVLENNDTILNVTAEILPRYPSGLPEEADPDLEEDLNKIFEANKEYLINKTGLIIRKLAIEVMILSEREKRSEKLKKLKLVLLDSEYKYSQAHYMLEITFKFKPLMKPVFEDNFYHSGIVFQEELRPKTKVKATEIRRRLKEKDVFPVLKLLRRN
jgi:hypothetical protein